MAADLRQSKYLDIKIDTTLRLAGFNSMAILRSETMAGSSTYGVEAVRRGGGT